MVSIKFLPLILAFTLVLVGNNPPNKKVTSLTHYGYAFAPTTDGTFNYYQVIKLDYPGLSYDCVTGGTACKISLPDTEVLNGVGTSDDDVVFSDSNEMRTIKIRKTWNSGVFGALIEIGKHIVYEIE